jgi:phosphatidylserine decarboxylase
VPGVAALPALVLSPWAALALVGLAGVVLGFHRDPDRTAPEEGVVAPADGRVSGIREEETEAGTRLRVATFMSPLDVHVNRAPAAAEVRAVEHVPGGHWPAFSKASDRNERVRMDCGDYDLVLIAGAMFRRIHPHVEAGETVARGQRIAHISFGSRVDVILPPGVERDDLAVSEGESMTAGETVVCPGLGRDAGEAAGGKTPEPTPARERA